MEDLTEILGTISESDPENIDKEEQQIKNKGSDANSGASVAQGNENNTRPQTEFYEQLDKYAELINVKTDVVIFGGDFNLITSERDSKTGKIKTGRRIIDIFNSIISKLNIKDTYRYRNKNTRVYSWTNFDNSSATRIDRIYLSKHICNKIKETLYIPFARSDHKGYKLRILIGYIKWGPGFWKLNESLLQQKKYTELIRNFGSHGERRN
ncbi:unnamed protein product [Mytilus coruscus]|uniref:Endonuclease/exonuclease/phosphatase domain-containing protein n=1 Tax=Mytilus coruscus TaxID=42192 RepID=A0A6J8C023_MYTCO|nr:unnamed protein product [Mytilus coruscus]